MEASADFIFKNSRSNFSLNKEEQLNSIDVSSSDPIPPLFVPKNTIQKKQTSIIDEIISRIYENSSNKNTKTTPEKININEIKQKIREKISIAIPLMNLQKHNSTPDKKDIMQETVYTPWTRPEDWPEHGNREDFYFHEGRKWVEVFLFR